MELPRWHYQEGAKANRVAYFRPGSRFGVSQRTRLGYSRSLSFPALRSHPGEGESRQNSSLHRFLAVVLVVDRVHLYVVTDADE
jgi:hypothetical protein